MRWRVGRRVGRTIYLQFGEQPSDVDRLIGMMDTPELAAQAVDAVNHSLDLDQVVAAYRSQHPGADTGE